MVRKLYRVKNRIAKQIGSSNTKSSSSVRHYGNSSNFNDGSDRLIIIGLVGIVALLFYIPTNPEYFNKKPESLNASQSTFILIMSALLIAIPYYIHLTVSGDYSKINNIGFFTLFGGITGVTFGEVLFAFSLAGYVAIFAYTFFMWIYAHLYSRYNWWAVASTTLFAGMLIENVMNRSALQVTTIMWVAILIYPYFITKIWEGKSKIKIDMSAILRQTLIFSIIGGLLGFMFGVFTTISPPLIFIGLIIPFVTYLPYKITKEN